MIMCGYVCETCFTSVSGGESASNTNGVKIVKMLRGNVVYKSI